MAVVLTLVQAKQIRINIHKRNNKSNTVQTIQNTVNASTHIIKTPIHYKAHTYFLGFRDLSYYLQYQTVHNVQ